MSKTGSRKNSDNRYKNPGFLHHMYHVENLTLEEIGNLCGVTDVTILNWMKHHDIPRDKVNVKRASRDFMDSPYRTNKEGYEQISWGTPDSPTAYIHRLVAIAHHGFDSVSGSIVMHKNRIRWDNRPGNLEITDLSGLMKKNREWQAVQK